MKRFTYQLYVDKIEYAPNTVEEIYGEGAGHNPDFSEDCLAQEVLGDLFKDAVSHCLMMLMQYFAEEKLPDDESKWTESQRAYVKYLKDKKSRYEGIQKTLKLICSEPKGEK